MLKTHKTNGCKIEYFERITDIIVISLSVVLQCSIAVFGIDTCRWVVIKIFVTTKASHFSHLFKYVQLEIY